MLAVAGNAVRRSPNPATPSHARAAEHLIGTLLVVGREGPFRSERCRFKTLSLVGGERPARCRHRFWPLRQRHSCRARLNLADCTAYELAMTMNAPLLFKGDDFAATDVRACL
jgi:hypothetical protein